MGEKKERKINEGIIRWGIKERLQERQMRWVGQDKLFRCKGAN